MWRESAVYHRVDVYNECMLFHLVLYSALVLYSKVYKVHTYATGIVSGKSRHIGEAALDKFKS